MPFGLTFSPTGQGGSMGHGTEDRGGAPLQEAIKVLNLRLPTVHGARGIAPGPLLASPGSAGLPGMGPGGMGLEQLLAMLFGALQRQPQPGPAQPGVAPMPMGPNGQVNVPPMMAPAGMSAGGKAPLPKIEAGIQAPTPTPPQQQAEQPLTTQTFNRPPLFYRM